MGTTPPVQLPPPTETATVTPTDTPSPTPTDTPSPTPTDTPSPTPTDTPTPDHCEDTGGNPCAPTPTPTPTPVPDPCEDTKSDLCAPTPTPTPTDTPTPTPTIDHDTCVDYRGGHSCEPTDKDNPDTGAGSRSVSPPVIPPNDIVICIERAHGTPATVSEGRGLPLQFQLLASRAPTEDLTVNVDVRTTGGTYVDTAPTTVEIVANNQSAMFPVTIDDDERDEQDTTLRAFVDPGDGYEVGTPSQASVRLEDDDVPAIPTNIRINGHRDSDGNVTLRWHDDGWSTAFDARWAKEICYANGGCERLTDWTETPDITTRPTSVEDTREGLLPLEPNLLYRVELRAKAVDTSDWSEETPVIVYPTNNPLGPTRAEIAYIKFLSYQTNGLFYYRVCTPTADPPDDDALTPRMVPDEIDPDFLDIVDVWEESVTWEQPNERNIIGTNGIVLTDCSTFNMAHNYVAFLNDEGYKVLCGDNRDQACFHSPPDKRATLDQAYQAPQTVVLRVGHDWATYVTTDCQKIKATLRHEISHVFGLGHLGPTPTLLLASPGRYRSDSVCEPSIWDVALIMANYQSR